MNWHRKAALLLLAASKRSVWKGIHRSADDHLADLQAQALKAFGAGRSAISKSGLKRALAAKDHQAVEEAVSPGIEAFDKAFRPALESVLLDVLTASGTLAAKALKGMRAAYDPDQPRDEKGQWTSEGGVFYHGTSHDRLKTILDEGITTSHTGENYPQSRKDVVYLATSEKEANAWGSHAAFTKHVPGSDEDIQDYVILKVHIPKEHLGSVEEDEYASEAVKYKGNIKPEWIKGYTVHSSMLGKPPKHRATESKDFVEIWVAVVLLEDEKPKIVKAAAPAIKGKPFKFDATNPAALEWAKAHAGETIDDMNVATIADIRDLVHDAFNEQFDVDTLADKITDMIGDDARAEVIARTETMRAANEGQMQLWDQATEAGLLTGHEQKEWITTPDDRLCPICEPLDGEKTGLDDTFKVDGDDIDGPPAHPNCRCTIALAP